MSDNDYSDSLPRVHYSYLESLKSIEDLPIVITGIVPTWPASTKWSTSYLKETYGHLAVAVRNKYKHAYTSPYDQHINPPEKMLFRDYIKNIIETDKPENKDYYMYEQDPKYFPNMDQDFEIPTYIKNKKRYSAFWLSCKGACTRLHYDLGHNLLAQVVGEKKLIIYRPNISCFYPYPESGLSQVNIEDPDYQKFPNFRFTQPFVCLLKAGEILYLPSAWWHQVHSLEDVNISVNFFWRPSLKYTLSNLEPLIRPKLISLKKVFKF